MPWPTRQTYLIRTYDHHTTHSTPRKNTHTVDSKKTLFVLIVFLFYFYQVFHDVAYKAACREDLTAGIDEFLQQV